MALDPGLLLGLAKLVLEPLLALVVDGSLQGDLAGELVAHLVEEVLQEEGPGLGQEQALLSAGPELESVLVVYQGHLLQGVVELAQVDQAVRLHVLA